MFKLFQSIFGKNEAPLGGLVTESLVQAAIERAVDGTDPRMRILPGYGKTLREPVVHAIGHVIALVQRLVPPVEATAPAREQSPALSAVFTSATRMAEILAADSNLAEYRAANPVAAGPLFALLAVQRNEKHGFGYALVDDKLVNDVQQTTVSFDEHRLLDIAADEDAARRLMMRRAFDYLLSLALAQVTEQKDERERLTQQRALLRVKLDILQKGGGGFSRDMGPQDRATLQTRLEEVESQLAALGPVHEVLQANLDIVAGVLADAGKHLWGEEIALRLDERYVLHGEQDTAVPAVPFQDVCDSQGRRVTVLMLALQADALPAAPDFATFLKG